MIVQTQLKEGATYVQRDFLSQERISTIPGFIFTLVGDPAVKEGLREYENVHHCSRSINLTQRPDPWFTSNIRRIL